jgi:hypothetical protein
VGCSIAKIKTGEIDALVIELLTFHAHKVITALKAAVAGHLSGWAEVK